MALISISEVAKLINKHEKTIYRHMSQGKISFIISKNGVKKIDTSEVYRVYGSDINHDIENDKKINMRSHENVKLEKENEYLKGKLEIFERLLEEKEKRNQDLQKLILLLENKNQSTIQNLEEKSKKITKPRWKFWEK